jgi:hypothetical protein
MVERGANFFSFKYRTNKILTVRLEGLFWIGNEAGCSFFLWTLGFDFEGFTLWPFELRHCGEFMAQRFGLWAWPLGPLHTMPGRRLQLLYFIGYVFSAHVFGLSTKVRHSIPHALDLDTHSVKSPFCLRSSPNHTR